jgi:DNA-binding winged helix-turn-helix (wHTH) protein/tetratricopeptide (TPR) repeat protein
MASSHWLFGPFRLDPDQAYLWHEGQPVPLTPKAFRVLHYLVTHADQLITKDELFDALWPDTVVSEAALRVCISELRKALGEGARAPQFIATVVRRGYRFLAPVTRQDPSAGAGAAPSVPRPPLLTPAAGRLVGREAVLARLQAAWAQASQGRHQVCFVSGEAGMGKTAVVEAFAAQVTTDPGVGLALGQCLEHYGTHEAYEPVLEALGQLARAPGGARLVTLLRQQAPTWLVQLPWLLTAADRAHFQYELQGSTRERMLREFAEVIETLTAETPLLLVLEDLHWSDYATLDLLALLARRRAPARLLVLGTYRPVDVIVQGHPLRTVVQTLQQQGYCQEVPLEPLSAGEVAVYLYGRFGQCHFLTGLAQALYQRTEGHPLFLINVLETLVRQGTVVQVGEVWTMPDEGADLASAVPDSLRPLIEQQVERLSATEQQVLAAASVAGMVCAVAVVAAALETEESVVDDVCATLAQWGQFLEASGAVRWPDGTQTACYRFRHSLYCDVLYHRIPLGRRQWLHQRMGVRAEAGYGARASEHAAVLARHFARGGDARRAVHYLRQAGDNALARSAYHEAVACYEEALEAVPQLPESRDTRVQAIDLRLALRSALYPSGDLGRILECLREAESLAVALDDPRRLAQVSVFLSSHLYEHGVYDQAIVTAQRAVALATVSGEGVLQALGHTYLGQVSWARGAYRRAIDCFRQTVASLDATQRHEPFGLPYLPAVVSHAWLAICHAELGTFAEGTALGEEGLRMAEEVAHPSSLMWASYGLGLLALRQGDLPRALPRLERAVALCQEATLTIWFRRTATALGAAYTLAGRVADAVPLLTQALTQALAFGQGVFPALCRLALGAVHLRAHRLEEAHVYAEQALALTRAYEERGHQAYALCLLGAIAVRRVPLEDAPAETYYQQARALAEELGMSPLVAHCHRGLGTLYTATGQREQARTELAAAIALYRTMDMIFWLPQTEVALAHVEER